MAKIVPLKQSAPVNEFGEIPLGSVEDGQGAPIDMTHVPGWSDLRFNRDLQMAEYASGHRRAEDVDALPGNVRWTRRMSAGGQIDGKKMMMARNAGYRPLTMDDIGSAWLTDLPTGATVQPDGSITNAAGDCVLTFADAAAAGRNARHKEAKMLQATASAGEKMHGADGSVESTAAQAGISVEKSTPRSG
jgi:hypothetical protein